MAPNFEKQFKLYVNASDLGMGAVLLQEVSSGVLHISLLHILMYSNITYTVHHTLHIVAT